MGNQLPSSAAGVEVPKGPEAPAAPVRVSIPVPLTVDSEAPTIVRGLQVLVGTTPVLVLRGHPRRRGVVLCNRSANTIFLGGDVSVAVDSGFELLADTPLELRNGADLWAVASAGDSRLDVLADYVTGGAG